MNSDNGLFDVDSMYEEEQQKESKKSRFFKGKRIEDKTATVVGIHGAHRGCGVTNLCVELAEKLSVNNSVAILERSGDSVIHNVRLKGVDTYTCEFREINSRKYDYILIDFGVMYDIEKSDIPVIKNSKDEIRHKQDEYWKDNRYCDKQILVCSGLPWRLKETEFYFEDTAGDGVIYWIKYITGNTETKEFRGFARDYYSDNIVIANNNEARLEDLIKLINTK